MKVKALLICVLLLMLWNTIHTSPNKDTKAKAIHFAAPYPFDGNFDPLERNMVTLLPTFRSIYSTLFKLDKHLRPYPFLLESIQKKNDTTIFYLKKEAKFSDGSDITAEDAVASIEAGMTFGVYPNPIYKSIEGGEELFRGKTRHCSGIKILGPKTFEIRFKNKNAEFSYYCAATIFSILPKHRNKSTNRNQKRYSGPFQVIDLKKNDKVTIVTMGKNPYYLGTKPHFDHLVIHFYNQYSDCEAALRNGEPDLFFLHPYQELPESVYKYTYYKTPTYGAFYLVLNPTNGPFKNKRLRTFIKHFVRSTDFTKDITWEQTIPTNLVLPYSLTGHFIFDQIKEEDYRRYRPKKDVTIQCYYDPTGIRKPFFQLLKNKLKKYKINLQLHWENMETIDRLQAQGGVDMTAFYYLVDVPLSSYFYETMFSPGHELNVFRYNVPAANQLLIQYRDETDELKRLKILSRLEDIAQDEAYLIPIMNPIAILGHKSNLKNVEINKYLDIRFEDIIIK